MDIKMQEIYILFCDTELYKVFTNYATAQKCLVDLNENRIKEVSKSNRLSPEVDLDRIMEIIQGEGGWYSLRQSQVPENEEDDEKIIEQHGEAISGTEYSLEEIRDAEWIHE